ncbi:unnamed protein product [Chrysodeixis includens]|uniref:Chemosensory protein n=1 Tax=Chrysodeixis includens TaxID=689277 RepID=A0A9P0BRZ5_CHRIL|nr:unnamed protein product [Chrysodeixis includens]
MKCIYLLVALAVAVHGETYDTVHDDLDVEALVADEAQFKAFVGCFIDTAPCNDVSNAFKNDAPEVIAQACGKCTTEQKHIVKVLTQSFKKTWPEDYEVFKKKYDPKGIYFEKLEAAVADY